MSQAIRSLITIFGGTGDLASRKLYPALYHLYSKGYLDEHFAVIGTARREWTDEHYHDVVYQSIEDIRESDEHAREFSKHFYYLSHNVKDTNHYDALKDLSDKLDEKYALDSNRIFYFSVSPNFFGIIAQHLSSQHLVTENGFNRVLIEKPFGRDYPSSKELNDEISEVFEENQLYRIDHYLGKEMIQNITALRFANPIISSIWNNQFISNVQITLSEDLGVEERGEYYDETGALRDMIQNHALQLLSLLAMDPPKSFKAEEIRKEKMNALNSLVYDDKSLLAKQFVKGQYAEASDDKDYIAYREEENVNEESTTETYVAGKMIIENDRWQGVPFYVRTGKRLKEKTTRVDIVFKENKDSLFKNKDTVSNVLTLFLGPDEGISLQLNDKKLGPDMNTHPISLEQFRDEETLDQTPEAYEKLILDALNGDETHFAHIEEVLASWKIVDSVYDAWEDEDTPIAFYESKSTGPKEADDLLESEGHEWVWKG